MKKINFVVVVWGREYLEAFVSIGLKSLISKEALEYSKKKGLILHLDIYTDFDGKEYINENLKNIISKSFISYDMEVDYFLKGDKDFSCLNFTTPIVGCKQYLFHNCLKNAFLKAVKQNAFYFIINPEFFYSKNFLLNILKEIILGKEIILFTPLRVNIKFDDTRLENLNYSLKNNGYITEKDILLPFYKSFGKKFHCFTKFLKMKKLSYNWNGNFKFKLNSKNIYIKHTYPIFCLVNPNKLVSEYLETIDCYTQDYWAVLEKFKEEEIYVMENLSLHCALDLDFSEPDNKYKLYNVNKYKVFIKSFLYMHKHRINHFFKYTYYIELETKETSNELNDIKKKIKFLRKFQVISENYLLIRNFFKNKIIDYYKNLWNIYIKDNSIDNHRIILVGERKMISFFIRNICTHNIIDKISIIDYDNFCDEKLKYRNIEVIPVKDLIGYESNNIILLRDKVTKDYKHLTFFKTKYLYIFTKFIITGFKLAYVFSKELK